MKPEIVLEGLGWELNRKLTAKGPIFRAEQDAFSTPWRDTTDETIEDVKKYKERNELPQ